MSSTSDSHVEPSQAQFIEQIYRYTAQQLEAGVSGPNIVQQLVERGLSTQDAAMVVRQTREARTEGRHAAGRKNMLIGALWCVGGLAVTFFSYQSASTGGGSYVVTWGAVVFGGIQFVRGLAQSMGE